MSIKTAGALPKAPPIFDQAKVAAAAPLMKQPANQEGQRSRKAGGRGIRLSGYIPPELDEALRDEVVKQTVAKRRAVALNDVLCGILADWNARRGA